MNLLSGNQVSQPRIKLELYSHLHRVVIAQGRSLREHRRLHLICQKVSVSVGFSKRLNKLYIRVFESFYDERLQEWRIFLREQHLGALVQ